jgi:hypothetical protein
MPLTVTILKSHNHHHAPTASPLCAGRNYLCIVNIDGPSQPGPDAPAAMIVKGTIPGAVRVVPLNGDGDPATNTAMGGCFVTGDDRFDQAARAIAGSPWVGPIPVHDYPIC